MRVPLLLEFIFDGWMAYDRISSFGSVAVLDLKRYPFLLLLFQQGVLEERLYGKVVMIQNFIKRKRNLKLC